MNQVAAKLRQLTNTIGGQAGELVFQEIMAEVKKYAHEQRIDAYNNGYNDGYEAASE
jgi:hypothetical protein